MRSTQEIASKPQFAAQENAFTDTSVSIRATVVATYPEVLSAFREMEASEPYLFLDRIDIRAALRDGLATEWSPLTVQFDATAFMPPTMSLSE